MRHVPSIITIIPSKEKTTKTWNVTIQATITKTYQVSADTEEEATEQAHIMFSVLNEEDVPEDFEQEVLKAECLDKEDVENAGN